MHIDQGSVPTRYPSTPKLWLNAHTVARRKLPFAAWAALILCLSLLSLPAPADEFRIDTMVFADGSQDAICKTATLITENRIYDHLTDDRDEVTVIDLEERKFVLLDIGEKRRSELSFEAVANFVRDATKAAQSSLAYVSFAANPRFETSDDHNGTVLRLIGSDLSYRVETHRAPNDRVVGQLKDFTDWSARLNTLRPGLPPAARLELNQKLAQRKRVPIVVVCEIDLGSTNKKSLTSRHEYSWQLAPSDRTAIAQYEQFIKEFRLIDPQSILRGQSAPAMVDTQQVHGIE